VCVGECVWVCGCVGVGVRQRERGRERERERARERTSDSLSTNEYICVNIGKSMRVCV